MNDYLQLIGLTLIGGLISLSVAVLLLSKRKLAEALAHYTTPFAAGALLGAVFLDLLKDGIEKTSSDTVLLATLIGMLIFFFTERFLRWFHHHHEHEDENATKPLIIAGDTLHNALDGVAIAAAFLLNPATGIVTTIAVAAHEIPQEIGDFGLLLKKGMSRRNVILVNIGSALGTTVAGVITYALGSADTLPIGFLLGLSAGFLLYIAASDIIPELHEHSKTKRLFDWQPMLLLLGVLVVGLSVNLAHRYIQDDSKKEYIQAEGYLPHIDDSGHDHTE
ncbi:ZIP family metal transporter [Candidatus Saccharibacteria bacterium]|nr:ZIP family metal transporter [Candidatus Saccharibacteria bacterium]